MLHDDNVPRASGSKAKKNGRGKPGAARAGLKELQVNLQDDFKSMGAEIATVCQKLVQPFSVYHDK